MPLLFAYTQILMTGTITQNRIAVASATLGTVLFSIWSTGYFHIKFNFWDWVLLALATILAFVPHVVTGMAGLAIFVAVFYWQRKRAATQINTDQPSVIAMK